MKVRFAIRRQLIFIQSKARTLARGWICWVSCRETRSVVVEILIRVYKILIHSGLGERDHVTGNPDRFSDTEGNMIWRDRLLAPGCGWYSRFWSWSRRWRSQGRCAVGGHGFLLERALSGCFGCPGRSSNRALLFGG